MAAVSFSSICRNASCFSAIDYVPYLSTIKAIVDCVARRYWHPNPNTLCLGSRAYYHHITHKNPVRYIAIIPYAGNLILLVLDIYTYCSRGRAPGVKSQEEHNRIKINDEILRLHGKLTPILGKFSTLDELDKAFEPYAFIASCGGEEGKRQLEQTTTLVQEYKRLVGLDSAIEKPEEKKHCASSVSSDTVPSPVAPVEPVTAQSTTPTPREKQQILKNGSVIPNVVLTTISMNLHAMKRDNPFAFGDLVALCRDPSYEIPTDAFLDSAGTLKRAGLLQEDGSVNQDVKNVVLCSVTENLELQSPLKDI